MTSDREFAEYLKSIPREKSEAEVERIEHKHDVERGQWVANQVVHHEPQEARH